MLLEFSVRNYRSFRDEQTLSLIAGPNEEHEDTHTVAIPGNDDERALRSAAIYGPNASGKTNLLLALKAMRSIVVHSAVASQRGDEIAPIDPFRLSERERTSPTRFEVSFVIDGTEHRYGFEATRTRVHEEWLYDYPTNRRRSWFERTYDAEAGEDDYKFYDAMRGEKQQIATSTRPNALYLSTAAQLNNDAVAPVFDWFRNQLEYVRGSAVQSGRTARLCEEEEMRTAVVTLLRAADVGIRDLSIEEEEEKSEVSSLVSDMMEIFDEYGLREELEDAMSRTVRFHHADEEGGTTLFDLEDESHGTQQFFSLAGPVLVALRSGQVLVVDELDASLHSRMVEELIDLFNNPESNPQGAQLIFNLHDTAPFDNDTLRRDQIWITEKFSDGATDLVALLEYGPRKEDALEKRYREGRYGGLPIPRIVQKAKMITYGSPTQET